MQASKTLRLLETASYELEQAWHEVSQAAGLLEKTLPTPPMQCVQHTQVTTNACLVSMLCCRLPSIEHSSPKKAGTGEGRGSGCSNAGHSPSAPLILKPHLYGSSGLVTGGQCDGREFVSVNNDTASSTSHAALSEGCAENAGLPVFLDAPGLSSMLAQKAGAEEVQDVLPSMDSATRLSLASGLMKADLAVKTITAACYESPMMTGCMDQASFNYIYPNRSCTSSATTLSSFTRLHCDCCTLQATQLSQTLGVVCMMYMSDSQLCRQPVAVLLDQVRQLQAATKVCEQELTPQLTCVLGPKVNYEI